ncbi:hypothetical protein N7541_007401 [Penicillium brevicompactum]|uniref:MT-A70-domain-containing protein n=1 Tax=Penicillium brevicompactum TaxID=5074 RepID=A0A9W9UMI6_PENBR|nr:hypothetical protein N7541_007401 [Penicillium brevicompactum]
MGYDDREDLAVICQRKHEVFLLDIPWSITLAQGDLLTPQQRRSKDTLIERRRLLSCPPLKVPYPSTEPKNPTARANVLETIPLSERRFHSELILPLVQNSLQVIRDVVSTFRWGLPRLVPLEVKKDPNSQDENPRKRRKKEPSPICYEHVSSNEPPVILSSTSPNEFRSLSDLSVVKNTSSELAIIHISDNDSTGHPISYLIPPESSFTLCTLPLFEIKKHRSSQFYPIPGLSSHQKFNLILMDPPWPNRSVRRSGHYQTHHYSEMEVLTEGLRDILRVHSYPAESQFQPGAQQAIAAIWITNAEKSRKAAYQAMMGSGFRVCEEWIWVKTTLDGQPISALDGIWRKPYEILVVGRRDESVDFSKHNFEDLTSISEAVTTRRVIAAVPDLHSRKPNLKGIFERIFFKPGQPQSYSALEVFARNLTAGWWAAGNEVLRFNAQECWVDPNEIGCEE